MIITPWKCNHNIIVIIIIIIFSASPCLGNYDDSPGLGREICIGSAHSPQLQQDTAERWRLAQWLVCLKNTWPNGPMRGYRGPGVPPTRYLTNRHPAISFTKTGACGNSGQLFFCFVFFSSFMGPWWHLGPGAAALVALPILTSLVVLALKKITLVDC